MNQPSAPQIDLRAAFNFAHEHHATQSKGSGKIPFLYHPMAVAALVLRYGGTEAQAKGALLHDTIAEKSVSFEEISVKFGAEVARLVFAFADPESSIANQGWRESKQAYLEKVRGLDEDCLLMIACEELHEGSELLHDLRYQGIAVWKNYPVHSMEVFWYFRELLQIFNQKLRGDRYREVLGQFASVVRSLKQIIFEGATT